MSGYQAALDYLARVNGTAHASGPMPGGTPTQAAQRIDFETPLPEMSPDDQPHDDSLAFPQDIENSLVPLEQVNAATEPAAPPQAARSNGYSDALAFLNRQAAQAATQQAVTEATTPDDRLPILKPELADALGVLDYRDPQEGQRRQQAAAIAEILNLPMFERVNLGAAPVNPDGTVTIRRAQAVNPEAQAAADAKLQQIQASAAETYKAQQEALNPSFFAKLQQRWRLGREQAVDDQLAYRAMMGEVDYEKVKDQLDPATKPLKGDNWFSEGVLTAAQMLPAMVDGIVAGNKLGLQGAMAGGTTALVAGQLGPQALAPEEVVTVPAAAALGYTAGTAAGSSEYWYKQGAGSMYHELRKEGVPHNVASTVAAGFGAPYAAIELAQVSKLVPGVSQSAAHAVAGGIKARLAALAKEKGVEYVEQIGQETAQELLSITGEKLAEWSAGVTPPKDKASAWDRIASTIQQTATSIPFLMAPKGVVDTVQTVRGNGPEAAPAISPAQPAPAEAPQNFTPIATPAQAPVAAAAPAAAPQTLGQVRAPEIPIDQAALDEAFGPATPAPTTADPSSPDPAPLSEIATTTSPTPAAASIVPESKSIAGEEASPQNSGTHPEIADFGPAFPEFTGNPIGAFAKLEETKTGEVPAALNHPTVGAVDVIWGQEGKSKATGFGLSKILKHHPEARPILENLFDAFDVKSENENTIQLELGDYSAVLRKNWKGQEKRWLLTSFGRNSAADGRTIDISAPVARSGDDTAPTKSGEPNKQPLKTNVNRFKSEAGYIDMGAVQDFGNSIYSAGVSFSKWAGQMLAKFGESISSVLKSIWAAVSGQNYLPRFRQRGSVLVPGKTTGSSKPRSFPQTVAAAPGVAPEVKAQLTSLEYDPVSNAETLAAARARIDAAGSIENAYKGLMGKTAIEGWQPSAEDYASGMELMAQLQNRGQFEDAAAIANMMAPRATDQGRAIQQLSLISRLGPQGIELFAQKQLQNAAVNGRNEKEKAQIQAKLDDAAQLRVEMGKVRHGATTSAIVGRRAEIKSALPAGADPVATNMAIRDAIMAAPTPLAAEAATASILTGQGVSETGATRISKSIVRDFLKTSQDARAKVLQDLQAVADKDRRLNKGKLGDLLRLNREGKLADSGLHAGMAKMLGIPHWSAEHSAKVQRIIKERERATDPRIKLVKGAEILDVVYREFMPPGIASKIDTVQTIMMLLNPKTIGRNVLGNTFAFAADLAADAVAIPMDALVSLGTGQRTRVGISLGEGLKGLGAGFADVKAGYDFARSEGRSVVPSLAEGVNTLVRLGRLQSSGKYDSAEINRYSGGVFSMPGLRHLETTLGVVLSIADRGFYESAFRRSLDNRMKAARANGTPMLAPDKDMVDAARMDAARAIYQNETATGELLSKIRKALNYFSSFGRTTRWGLGSMIFKFTTTPSSILHRALDFSPIGFIKSSYELLAPMLSKNKEFDQKAFVDAFSQALVGTTGLVALGYWLSHLGIISAGSSADDEKKRNLEKARGWGNYKINVDALKRALMTGNFWTRQLQYLNDRTETYDWAQPLSIAVAMGAYARENQTAVRDGLLRGKKQNIFDTSIEWLTAAGGAATGAMNSLMEQPLLSGLNTFFKNASYDGLPGAIMETAVAIPGSFIPTAARQWMQLTDNSVRETRDSSPYREYINQLKAQLPGLSKTLPQKYDIAGQPVERWAKDSNTVFNVLFNPGMTTYIKGSPALTEMSRVFEMTANPGAVPNQVSRDFTLDGVKVRLTDEEISALQKDMGALSVAAIEKYVLADPRYDNASWDIKAKAFTRALEKAAEAAKYRVLLSRPDLKTRAAAEHRQMLQNRAAESRRREAELAATGQAMSQLQPGP